MKCFKPQNYKGEVVSCGRCAACKQNRINGWVARLENHARYQETAHFITLTYAPGQCKITVTDKGEEQLSLSKEHIIQFIKRYKKLHNENQKRLARSVRKSRKSGKPVRPVCLWQPSYFISGEYGSKNRQAPRPHYHLIMFNIFLELIPYAWSFKVGSKWYSRGSIHAGNTDHGSIRYSLKYINKPSRIPLFQGDKRTREFSIMSKGIGKNYLTERIIKWHQADLLNRYFIPANGGTKIPMPRYYADKIYTKKQKAYIAEHLESIFNKNFRDEINKDIGFLHQFLSARDNQEKKLQLNKATLL